MFLRFIHLSLRTQAFDKERKKIKNLFILTEIFIWSAFAIWIYYMIPAGKPLFALFLAIVIAIYIVFWFLIRNKVAKMLFKSAFKLNKNDNFMLDGEHAKLLFYKKNTLVVKKSDKTEEFKYDIFLSHRITKPYKQHIEISIKEDILTANPENIYATLKENGFINENTKVEVSKKDNLLVIDIETYNKKTLQTITEFLKKIL